MRHVFVNCSCLQRFVQISPDARGTFQSYNKNMVTLKKYLFYCVKCVWTHCVILNLNTSPLLLINGVNPAGQLINTPHYYSSYSRDAIPICGERSPWVSAVPDTIKVKVNLNIASQIRTSQTDFLFHHHSPFFRCNIFVGSDDVEAQMANSKCVMVLL